MTLTGIANKIKNENGELKMSKRTYAYYQPNDLDLKDNHSDCVVRAITKLFDITWLQAFDELVPYARKLQSMPNGKMAYEKYLLDHGYTYHGISNKKGSKRPTVESFSLSHKTGRYFLNLANHVVAVVDGKYYDTWDCGECCLYGYYELEEQDA